MNFQQLPQTLQFQRCECVRRQSIRGIACDIRGQHPQRESYSAGSAAARAAARRRRRWRASGLTRRIPPVHTTCPSPTVTTQWATHRLPMKQAPTRGVASRPPRGHAQTPDETTAFNTDFPASTSQKVTIQPPRFSLSHERPITRRRLVTTKRERGPLPGLLTVDYFTTSPGGILAPHTKVSNVSRKTRVRHLAAQQHTS